MVIETTHLSELQARINKLQKDNDRMMMTFYSAEAAGKVMDEIREIINCPPGYSITEAVRKLKGNIERK